MGTEQSCWICEIHAALEKKGADDDPSQPLIWKVPAHYWTKAELFEPVSWRFGLHHRRKILHINGTEGFKIEVARALQLTGEQWDSFCERVVPEPKEHWEAVYAQSPHASSYTIEEIRCRLSLDALFLVVDLQRRGGGIKSLGPALREVMKIPVLKIYYTSLMQDFSLVQNQIPIDLLKRVVGILTTECSQNVGDMRAWEDVQQWQGQNIGSCIEWDHFRDPLNNVTDIRDHFRRRMKYWLQDVGSYDDLHILDSTYRILRGWENLGTFHRGLLAHTYSATDLEACGVKIKGKQFTCFEDISFENGCLSVPFLQVYDTTEKYLRNLVVHEELTRPRGRRQHSVRYYTFFMEGLMRTPEDVNLLMKRGVFSHYVGSDNVVGMWKHVNYYISKPAVSVEFFTMMKNLRNYTKVKRYKYWFEFKKQFCSRPWLSLSVFAATIVTVATLMQTYVLVIGSNGMKSHFPP